MDYEYMALSVANLSGIPVRLYREDTFVAVYHTSKFKPDLAIIEEQNILKSKGSVSYYITPEFLVYGLLRVKDVSVSMVLGPVCQIPVDRNTARTILKSIGEPPSRAPELQQYLSSIPSYPLNNFLQILCSLLYSINAEKVSVSDILMQEVEPIIDRSPSSAVQSDESSEKEAHNTYDLEQSFLSCIEHGRPDELERMFQMPASGKVGRIAHDVLRQQKNTVIVATTLASRAAIRGGLDVETALTLSDLNIQKAELLNNCEGLMRLSAKMMVDYARRVEALHCGDSNRTLIRSVRQYILTHINEKITTEELAEAVGRNRSYLSSLFKAETGIGLSDYITKTKIDEAKRLLTATNKPLKAISDHLGFSSQSHFQNAFKKVEGITPTAYRSGK